MALQINGASFALQYRRTNSKSIDSTAVWETLADAQTYAANTDDVAYVPINGQVISVTENNKAYQLVTDDSISTTDGKKHYKLQEIATADQLNSYVSKNLFSSIFGLIDADGNELDLNTADVVELTDSIKAKFGLWTEQYLSAKGQNDAEGEIPGGGINEEQLEDYLTTNNYAKKSDIPSLAGYATEDWVIEKGYITTSALQGYATESWVLGKSYATTSDLSTGLSEKFNSSDFTKANIQSTLGISDWALASTKPSYEFSEIGNKPTTLEGYGITDAYNQEQIDGLLGNKLDVVFFKAMFGLMTEDGEIEPNSEIPTEATIKAKFGLWTEQFLSAKGLNPSDGSVTGISLKDLAGVNISSPQNGEGLVYQDGYWVNQVVQTGGDGNPFYVWQGESEAAPTLKNAPANQWTTTALKNEHIDDYYITTKGLVYQFTNTSGTYSWELVTDKYLIDCWNKLDQFDDDLTERVGALEAGSATNIQSVGVGNVVTDVTKSGTVITVNKDISVYTKSEIDTKTNNISQSITSVSSAVSAEAERAKSAEATLTTNLNIEVTRAKAAEQTLTTNLNSEISRAKAAEQAIANDLLALVNKLNQMFTLEGDGSTDNPYRIKANYGLYTDQFLSALGYNSDTSGGSGGESLSDSLVWHASAYWYNANDAGANGAALITVANNSKNFCTFDFVSSTVGTYKIDISSGYYVRPMSSTQSHPDSYTQVKRSSSTYTNGAQLTSETILNSLGGTHWTLNIGKGSGFSQAITLEEAKAAVTFTKL